jgi:hypothetical protein
MNTKLKAEEIIKKQGSANLQKDWESVGGHLYLTNKRLIFESHAFNVQAGTTIIELDSITTVTKCWTLFLNSIRISPNSILVDTKDGRQFKFVLYNRGKWITAIGDAQIK